MFLFPVEEGTPEDQCPSPEMCFTFGVSNVYFGAFSGPSIEHSIDENI